MLFPVSGWRQWEDALRHRRQHHVIRQQEIVLGKKTALASGTAGQVAAFVSGLQAYVSDGTEEKRCKITVEDSVAGKTAYATYSIFGMTILFR